jgi:hypothetical protein
MTNQKSRSNRPRKKTKWKLLSPLKAAARQTRYYLGEHVLGLLGLLLTITAICLFVYVNILQPDIRYIPVLPSGAITVVDRKVDLYGNFVYKFRIKAKFTNFSIKTGFVDRVEFDPQTVANLPDIKVTTINRVPIHRHEEKEIAIDFLLTLPTDAMSHPDTWREASTELVMNAFDNTGKKIDKFESGPFPFGRIKFNLKEIIKAEFKRIQ